MKKLIIVFILCSSMLMAQEFKKNLMGKMIPAKVDFPGEGVKDVLMKYQSFEYFRFPQKKLTISRTGSEADTAYYTLQVPFLIDGNIWAVMPKDGSYERGILTRQGAISSYEFIKYGDKKDKTDIFYLALDERTATMHKKAGTSDVVLGKLSNEKIRQWVSDSPEIMLELKQTDSLAEIGKIGAEAREKNQQRKKDSLALAGNGPEVKQENAAKLKGFAKLKANMEAENKKEAERKAAPVTPTATTTDLSLIVNNYNALYEQKNPGKIKYYFDPPPVRKKSPLEDFRDRQIEQESFVKRQDEKAAAKKKIDDLFVNRTTTPSPENASAKDNVPVKKETFAAKLQRIKGDGNKVGIIFYLQPVRVNVPTDYVSTGLTSYVAVEGEYLDESLNATAREFVTELNGALGTTDIELIDINNVPYRNSKFGKLDDWWAGKYKVVFAYSLDPRLRTASEEIGGKVKFTASLNVITSLIVREYIGGPGATKQDIITQVLNMGSFVTPTYAQDDQIKDVKLIYDKTLEKLAVPILSKIREERADGVKKLVEKRLKP